MNKKIYLSYNPEEIQDGYFAQLQRQLAIIAIAEKFRCSYYHNSINQIDGIMFDLQKNQNSKETYVEKMNEYYRPHNVKSINLKFDVIVDISCPSAIDLLKLIINFRLKRKSVQIRISNPHAIMERITQSYLQVIINHYPSHVVKVLEENLIVAHIRKGVSESHILPTEEKPRALSENYYLEIIKKILVSDSNPKSLKLQIFTDAPEADLYFQPEEGEDWGEFDYRKTNGKIHIEGHSFSTIRKQFPGQITVFRNGNPNDLVIAAAKSKYFIMSRSSMSFVAALFHPNGLNFYPPNFWHRPLNKWRKATE
jgi:hypothetical protein